jgi:hypothetical protein
VADAEQEQQNDEPERRAQQPQQNQHLDVSFLLLLARFPYGFADGICLSELST